MLTDAGRTFLQHAQAVDQACSRAHDAMASQRPAHSVRLRVGATDELGTNLLAPLGLHFTQNRPEIALDLQIMPKSRLFLPDSDLDCMICAGLPAAEEGADLIARGFARYVSRLYASPHYIARRGMLTSVDDLPLHDLVANAAPVGTVNWHLTDDATQRLIEPSGPLHTNDNWVAKVCVIQGQGIGLFPEFFAREHVLAGDLVEVLPNWHTVPTAINVLHHGHRFANLHIQEFIAFLVADFEGFYHFPYRSGDILRRAG
ncbi:DNA-binding transcriptional LysR family regulator [Devosia sp. UYZn731]|uniref:LysR substrate-binding domain-containing protein n=1 Tax=Devosia sp. UYZn731 TaxID=3156345 RepID=UPI003394DDB8